MKPLASASLVRGSAQSGPQNPHGQGVPEPKKLGQVELARECVLRLTAQPKGQDAKDSQRQRESRDVTESSLRLIWQSISQIGTYRDNGMFGRGVDAKEVSDRMLHWSVIIGQEREHPFCFLLLDTNGALFEIKPDTLRTRMDLGEHISRFMVAQLNPIISFEHISRFNSISCTWFDMRADFDQYRTYRAHHNIHRLRGNRNTAHNLANTVLDSPIINVTPLAPLSWLWRLL